MFVTTFKAESQISGRWKLIAPVIYQTHGAGRIVVPAGYETDLFSVPRVLWPLFPRDNRGRRSAVVHDWLYNSGQTRFTRADADRIFRQALADLNIGWFTRWAMYAGVRVGGWTSFKRGNGNV